MEEILHSSFRSFLFLTSLLLCTLQSLPTLSSFGNETDRDALLDLKLRITRDPLGTLSLWNDSVHFCTWPGVTCGRRHRRVTVLDLRSHGLIGSLSPAIGNLTFLREVHLQNNSFEGVIPQQVGGLFRLRNIRLSRNSLGGEIPSSLSNCSNLKYLFLYRNKLVGKIPVELGSLSKLMILTIHDNNLTGKVPLSFGNLSSLQVLSSGENNLEGRIPEELGRLRSLTYLGLGENKMSGMIPSSLYNLSSMVTLVLTQNQFHGSLPSNIGLTFPNIKTLAFGINKFSGHIPASFSNASGIEAIDLLVNNFVGRVPDNLGGLQSLWSFSVGVNNLGSGEATDWSFLASLANCTSLRSLNLEHNKFGGELPKSIGNLSTQMSMLYLGRNVISGSIPTEIGNLINLTVLGMEYNLITDSIPSSIGRLQKLNQLFLHENMLSGRIPSSLGNITSLSNLYLQQNHLNGSIPSSLGNCTHLQILHLSENNLDGTIPKQVIGLSSLSIFLGLSHNSLTGFLPPEVGKLNNLGWLDISENKLSGNIPSSLGDCSSLEILNTRGNFFEGDIPPSLASLKGIQRIDLSRNNLSGKIPKALVNLIGLQELNLSFNHLEGEVPTAGIFVNASVISVIGNTKLCGGTPELKLRSCSNQEPRKSRKSHNLKVIVPIITAVVSCLALVVLFYFLYWKGKPRKNSSSTSSLEERFLRVSYEGLLKATDGFASANLVGAGSFGSVYKGILQGDDKPVAVKVLNLQQHGASKSFMAECEALRNIRHRNLLNNITSCSSVDFKGNDFKALVFEFMPNGSLDDWLHPNIDNGQHQSKNLNLTERLNIAIDVASALDYLHQHCEMPIVHCDLKPSNVLLNNDMIAHVGDFGLAKFLSLAPNSSSKDQSSSVAVKGSIGYVAPEYGMGNEVSMQGDVYSYGILLLEMVTGKRPVDSMFTDGVSLHSFSKMALPEQVMEIVDSRLLVEELNEGTNHGENQRDLRGKMQECLVSLVKIGVACSEILPSDRMEMKDVLRKLHLIKEL